MKTFTFHVHTNHQPTIDYFIVSMTRSGYYVVSVSFETQTGTHYIRMSRPI